METNLDTYKKDLAKLIDIGGELFNALQFECYPEKFKKAAKEKLKDKSDEYLKKLPSFKSKYQLWYSEAIAIIKLLLPDRLLDFIKYYEKPKTRKEIKYGNYVIEDYLQNLSITRGHQQDIIVGPSAAIPQFEQQLNILKSVERRFESTLFDIKQLVQADLFDSELGAAKELLKNKFNRAAGAISGVVLEKHLQQVSLNHNLTVGKKDPSINDFNELLKKHEIIDIPQWRFIQHLGDIRNLCDHNKSKEPTTDEVNDLINGVDKITKTIF